MEFKTDLERELFNLCTKNAAEHDKLLAERDALEEALRKIMDARDYHADNAEYPLPPNGPDHATQCFDDWAADVASEALDPKEDNDA